MTNPAEMSDAQIVEMLATKVMGWDPGTWATRLDRPNLRGWDPLTDARHSKQVREKLFHRYRVIELRHDSEGHACAALYPRTADSDAAVVLADTEERAVALCALKTVGVEL